MATNFDHNIFLRGAAMQQQNRQNTFDQIARAIEGMERNRDKKIKMQQLEAEKLGDVSAQANAGYMALARGEQPTPNQVAAMDVKFAAMRPVGGVDETGRTFVKQPIDPRDRLRGAPQSGGGLNLGAIAPAGAVQPAGGVNIDAMMPAPALPQVNPAVRDVVSDGERVSVSRPALAVDPYYATGPKAKQKTAEKDIDVRGNLIQKEGEADIAVSQKMGEAYGTTIGKGEAEKEMKTIGLGDLLTGIEQLEEASIGTPSGALQGIVASGTNILGIPTEQAVAAAGYEAASGLTGLQARVEFLKGQGTITDGEAKQAMSFIPNVWDSAEVKEKKLGQAKDYIRKLIKTKSGETLPERAGDSAGFRIIRRIK